MANHYFSWVRRLGKLLSVLLALCWPTASYAQQGNVDDNVEYQALMALFNATDGPNWQDNTNWGNGTTAADFKYWHGITIDNDDVIAIELDENQLAGTLPPELNLLAALQVFSASGNQLVGPLPDLRACSNLAKVDVSHNNLPNALDEVGQIVPPSLTDLNLSYDNLRGALPYGLVRFPNLNTLDLSHNKLDSGFIDDFFYTTKSPLDYVLWSAWVDAINGAGLASGVELDQLRQEINGQQLTSPLWASLLWTSWEAKIIDDAQFYKLSSQLIGLNLQGLKSLKYLNLSFNQFNQPIPAALPNAAQLNYLDLSINQFKGALPATLGNLSNLTYLNVTDNNLSGTTPASISQLTNLSYINLGSNHLEGPILQQLRDCADLTEMWLSWNNFTGPLPLFFTGQWPALTRLDAGRNAFGGGLPASLTRLASLQYLNLSYNQLTGTLPVEWSDWPSLKSLVLNNNQLSGAVPQSFAAMPQLRVFQLAANKLTTTPNFQNTPFRTSMSVDVSANAICFGPLETNAIQNPTNGIVYFWPAYYAYQSQVMPEGEDIETQSVAEPIVITCSFSGSHNIYQWQKRNASGTWQALTGNGATSVELRINQPTMSDAGSYRCAVSNQWLTGLTLYTRTTTVVLTADNTYQPPIQPPVTPAAPDDRNRNWTLERTYDGVDNNAANVLAESKQFTDGLGRATQAQARSRANPHVFASQTVYSTGGQPVLQTLAAPIDNQVFAYKDKFVEVQGTTAGTTANYGPNNFEGSKANNPDALTTASKGTLGYYFSATNALEPLTPTTTAPYSLTEPATGSLGGLKRAAAPGDAFRMGSGHEMKGREIPVLNEFDDYMRLRHHFVPGSNNSVTMHKQSTKTITVDADGRESVVIQNKEGQALISCLTGSQYPAVTLATFISTDLTDGNPSFVDIHIPATGEHQVDFTLGGQVRIENLNGEQSIRTSPSGSYLASQTITYQTGPSASYSVYLLPGFYRLTSLPSTIANEQTQWFTYKAEYGNFSYNYYDVAGRIVATIAPNGLPGSNEVRNPGFENQQIGSSPLLSSEWEVNGTTGTGYIENTQAPHGGQYYGVHWSGTAHSTSTSQTLTGLKPGNYILHAWVRSTGGQNTAEMYASSLPAGRRQVPIVAVSNSSAWSQITLENIIVGASGQCEIGFYSSSVVPAWILFDDIVFARQPDIEQPNFITRNTYDTNNRLVSTQSSEDGKTEYVYARDGRIRFSQSALQRPAGRYSYSEYDALGRVVESGEYTPFGQLGYAFQNQLPKSVVYEAEASSDRGGNVQVTSHGGSSFIGYFDQPGAYLAFNVNVATAGTYSVRIRYTAGQIPFENRTLPLYLQNSQTVGTGYLYHVTFPTTNSWDRADVQTLELPLRQGDNRILFQQDRSATDPLREGKIDFDYLEVISEQSVPTTSVLQILEARTKLLAASYCTQRNFVAYSGTESIAGRTQEFTLGAVSKTWNDKVTTWYSYDELGRVTWVVQDIVGLGTKTLDYKYDFAGNVLEVAYQHEKVDAFHHYYEYDQVQRLYKVYTSTDGTVRALQAKYFYYLHGPLKRVELANRLQGLDYIYTLQGWLKSLNHVNQALDPSHDSPTNNGVPKDLFGLTLDYFSGDYQSQALPANSNANQPSLTNAFRYGGTIRAATWRTGVNLNRHQYAYDYDDKSQLAQSAYRTFNNAGTLDAAMPADRYKESGISYDPNGNMQNLRRANKTGQATDNFSYQYTPGTNRLSAVHTGSLSGATVLDYEYDALGQMTREREGTAEKRLTYDVSGKVTQVVNEYNRPLTTFTYDDKGFRLSKTTHDDNGDIVNTTTYVRDLSGNVLSTYESNYGNAYTPTCTEIPLYGASRIGVQTRLENGRDEPRYEINDHLGNARVVFHRPTTTITTASFELSTAAQQEDGQWSGLAMARRYSNTAHQGVTTPSNYIAYVAPGTAGAGIAQVHRTVPVQKGDTLTFSAWTYIFPQGVASSRPSRVQVVPLPVSQAPISGQTVIPHPDGKAPTQRTWLSRLTAGVAITGWGSAPTSNTTIDTGGGTGNINTQVWIRYRIFDEQDVQIDEQYQYLTLAQAQHWQQLSLGIRIEQPGKIDVAIGSNDLNWQSYFDDLRLDHTDGLIVQEQHQYAYGSPLTGLNYAVGNKRYRYGYQGQSAEQDTETGWESFDLRLYNSRIGRWTSYDPAGQFCSPYIGMGNNPSCNTDPDGGWMFSITGAGFGALTGALIGAAVDGESGAWKGALIGFAAGGIVGGIGDNPGVSQEMGAKHPWNELRYDIGLEGRNGPTNVFIKGSSKFTGTLTKEFYKGFDGSIKLDALRVPIGAAKNVISGSFSNTRGASSELHLYRGDKRIHSVSGLETAPNSDYFRFHGRTLTAVSSVDLSGGSGIRRTTTTTETSTEDSFDSGASLGASRVIRVVLKVHKMPGYKVKSYLQKSWTSERMTNKELRDL